MRALSVRSLLVAVFVFGAAVAGAQTPGSGQVQQLLQSNPQLLQQLQQRIATSGLTPDQIRSRLQAQGYPSNLLDSYLGSGSAGASGMPPTPEVFSAVTQLGIADTTDLTPLRCGVNPDTLASTDSLFRLSRNSRFLISPAAAQLSRAALDSIRYYQQTRLAYMQCRAQLDSLGKQTASTQAPPDSGFNIFGLDFFRRPTTVFNPNLNGPVDANYRLGPGDRLVLVLTGDVEASYTLDVTREGFIVIPQVGQVYVNNLTLGQLRDVLYDRLGRVYSGVRRGAGATTQFSVTPARIRTNMVYVVGDVVRPGAYQVSAAATLLNAVYQAGGPTNDGSLRDIQVRRDGVIVSHMDFYDYLINGDASHDVRLQNGDIVFIPVHLARVRVVGEVVRPATYEIKPTETLADAIRFAGGFKADASRARVQIERIVPPAQRVAGRDRIITDVVSSAFVTGHGPTLPLEPGDIVRVFPITTRVHNRVTVTGDVRMPGSIGLTPGMTVSGALKLAGGVKPDVYLGEVLVSRLQPDSTRLQLRAMLRDSTGAVVNDFPLHEDDNIHVFSVTEFRPDRYVAINGAVRKPGRFKFHEGMTVRDLVLMAGGLEQSAYLNEARVARLPADRSNGITASEFTVPLDSSYLFERGPDGKYFGPPGLPAPAGPTPDVALSPYDNVLILRQPGWELQRTADVEGEVRFPGRYTLLNKQERISDLIARAGGLTPQGYANGVTFYRTRDSVGRIGIELPNVLRDKRDRDNLLVQNGDSIFIPRYSGVVRVQGAVNSPVAVTYVPGRDLNYYIRAAGGPRQDADVGRAYVTQPNGKVDARESRFLLPDYIPDPQPGGTVFVPAKSPTEVAVNPIAAISALAGTLSTLVAILLAVRR